MIMIVIARWVGYTIIGLWIALVAIFAAQDTWRRLAIGHPVDARTGMRGGYALLRVERPEDSPLTTAISIYRSCRLRWLRGRCMEDCRIVMRVRIAAIRRAIREPLFGSSQNNTAVWGTRDVLIDQCVVPLLVAAMDIDDPAGRGRAVSDIMDTLGIEDADQRRTAIGMLMAVGGACGDGV